MIRSTDIPCNQHTPANGLPALATRPGLPVVHAHQLESERAAENGTPPLGRLVRCAARVACASMSQVPVLTLILALALTPTRIQENSRTRHEELGLELYPTAILALATKSTRRYQPCEHIKQKVHPFQAHRTWDGRHEVIVGRDEERECHGGDGGGDKQVQLAFVAWNLALRQAGSSPRCTCVTALAKHSLAHCFLALYSNCKWNVKLYLGSLKPFNSSNLQFGAQTGPETRRCQQLRQPRRHRHQTTCTLIPHSLHINPHVSEPYDDAKRPTYRRTCRKLRRFRSSLWTAGLLLPISANQKCACSRRVCIRRC